MKTLKYLTICFVVCCLFSSHAFGQFVNVNAGITGELDICPGGVNADVAVVGQTIIYSVLISTDAAAFPIENAVASLTLPNGTEIPIPIPSDLPPGYSSGLDFTCFAPYVVAVGDLGQLDIDISPGGTDPIQADEVRALVNVSGTAITTGGTDEAQASAVRTTTIEFEPCVEVIKEPDCEFSKVGDTVNYTYTIENCGDVDLDITSVIDDVIGDLTGLAEAACDPLPAGGSCSFEVPYVVQEGDDSGEEGATLVNVVTVDADGIVTDVGVVGSVSDSDDAEVTLLHPDFTVDVACEIPEEGLFSITIENTGDVPLDIDSCLGIVTLVPGETATGTVEEPISGGGLCGTGGEATYTCDAVGTIPPQFCELPNVLERSDSATCEVAPCDPSFTVEKTCLTSPLGSDCALSPGDTAQYEIVIENTSTCEGSLDLYFVVDDAAAGISGLIVGPIAKGASETLTADVTVPDCPADQDECVDLLNEVIVTGYCDSNDDPVGTQSDTAICEYSCGEPEGCTPGFWKNHPDCWCDDYEEGTR
jgi:uncharacterized repeat protein (TIGR01451 family)